MSVQPDYKHIFPFLLSVNKTRLKMLFGSKLCLLRLTSEIKIEFIFGLLTKFDTKSTLILNIYFSDPHHSENFGYLRQLVEN